MKLQIQMASHQGWFQPNRKQQETKLQEKRGGKQSAKQAAMWAEQPRKSDLLWILLELKEISSRADVFFCS